MEAINNIVGMLNGPIWGVGMLVLIVGSGLYFTIRLGFFQFVHFKDMWSRIIDKSESESGISSFASFCTTMAMRVGTGNVAGVAVALYMGGPGALFWMIIAGMTNSAVCFTECTLSVLYKNRIDGQYRSGGAYCAERGLGWKAYGAFYAAFFGLGVVLFMPAAATYTICDGFKNALGIPMWVSALVIALAMAVVVMGGVKRISSVASMLVPPMVGIYLIATVVILIANAGQIPSVIVDVVKCAFGSKEALLGGGVGIAIQQGVKRGTFSSASGMGESMPTAAAAETSHPVKQGLVQMLSVFIDTLLICTATAFMLLCSGVEPDAALEGAPYVQAALSAVFGPIGPMFITVAMVLFAFTTLIGNLYYVDNCLNYIVKKVPAKEFMVLFRIDAMLLIFIGAGMQIGTVWNLADVLMGVMALINLPVIILLSRPALLALKDYTAQKNTGRNPVFKAETVGLKGKTEYWN